VSFNDDGRIQIDWHETEEMQPEGGQFHTTYITLSGRETDLNVDYYAKELTEDADQLLHLALKMLKEN
jgi:hypothetical protein